MDNYLNEICDICKLPFNEINQDFKVIQLGTKAIYVCNFKKIIDYSIGKVVLKIQKGTLEIIGNDLYISQINKSEIIIKGFIESFGVGVIDEKKKK
ncbi:MAG: YabP/YqfC family sporulation protein [Christensenellales bacterium]